MPLLAPAIDEAALLTTVRLLNALMPLLTPLILPELLTWLSLTIESPSPPAPVPDTIAPVCTLMVRPNSVVPVP